MTTLNCVHVYHIIAMLSGSSYYKIIISCKSFYNYVKLFPSIEHEAKKRFIKDYGVQKICKNFLGNGQKKIYHLTSDGIKHGTDEEWWGCYLAYSKSYFLGNLDGRHVIYYPQSHLIKTVKTYYNGELHGECREYDHNGTLRLIGYYSRNRKNGEWKTFDDEANILLDQEWIDGTLCVEVG